MLRSPILPEKAKKQQSQRIQQTNPECRSPQEFLVLYVSKQIGKELTAPRTKTWKIFCQESRHQMKFFIIIAHWISKEMTVGLSTAPWVVCHFSDSVTVFQESWELKSFVPVSGKCRSVVTVYITQRSRCMKMILSSALMEHPVRETCVDFMAC